MSSILKALKKLEQEKTLRREGEIDLSREILQDAWRRKTRFSRPLAAAITTIVLLLALITILLSRGTAPIQPVQTQPPAPPREASLPLEQKAAPPEVILPKPAPSMPQPAEAVVQKPAPAATLQPAPATTQQPTAKIPVPLPSLQPRHEQTESIPSLPSTASPPATLPPPSAKKPAPPAESAEPAFSVSGIAWNKDSADRLAIINGQPLTTGSAVGGAVVEEILPDRVRFSRGGGSFEVHLGKAGKTH